MKTIKIPARMRHLVIDHRGYPIPVTVLVDEAGRPNFTINDEAKRQEIIRDDRCPICGDKLLRGRWSVGGQLAAFQDDGAYVDPPMHGECAYYALRVCPYLAAPKYSKRLDTKTIRNEPLPPLLTDPMATPGRPHMFVAVFHDGQELIRDERTGLVCYIKPRKPYRRVEYWRHGQRLTS